MSAEIRVKCVTVREQGGKFLWIYMLCVCDLLADVVLETGMGKIELCWWIINWDFCCSYHYWVMAV